MPFNIDAREVLKYLNELGYTNISAKQLKEFMIDLKRLIKYEEQYNNVHPLEDICENDEYEDCLECEHCKHVPTNKKQCSPDVFNILHNSETAASLAKRKANKKVPSKSISIHIKNVCPETESCINVVPKIHLHEVDSPKSNSSDCNQQSEPTQLDGCKVSKSTVSMPTTSKSCPSLTGTGTTVPERKRTRPKSARSSFIRPKVQNKPLKSDPVALYHQYKEIWNKIKFPGENHHVDTRWAIRERMLGDNH